MRFHYERSGASVEMQMIVPPDIRMQIQTDSSRTERARKEGGGERIGNDRRRPCVTRITPGGS